MKEGRQKRSRIPYDSIIRNIQNRHTHGDRTQMRWLPGAGESGIGSNDLMGRGFPFGMLKTLKN